MYLITKKESRLINVLKVIAMFMVIFIHASASVNHEMISEAKWLSDFKYLISGIISCSAVPIFFMISGMLLFRKDFNWFNNIKKKLKTLMVPYLIVNILWIMIFLIAYQIDVFKQFFFNQDWIIENWGVKQWVDAFVGYPKYPMVYPLWFLRDLFILNILSKIIKSVIDKYPKLTFLIMLFLWVINFNTQIFFLQYQAVLFFSLGYYLIKYNIRLSDFMKINYWLVVFLYLLFIIFEFLTRSIYVHQIQILIALLFWICTAGRITNDKLLNISKYTFSIFLFHEWSLTILKKLFMKFISLNDMSGLLIYLFVPFLVIFLIIGASKIMEKYFARFYYLLTGAR